MTGLIAPLVAAMTPSDSCASLLVCRRNRALVASGVGITLDGDAEQGRFEGLAAGSWTVVGGKLVVTVEKKPAFAPWPMVMSQLEKAFRQGV